MKKNLSPIVLIFMICILGMLWSPAQAADTKNSEMVINLDVSSKAQVTQILINQGKWADQPAVWVKAKIKNTSDKPAQYKTKCYFHGTEINRGFMLPAVGRPLIKPGAVGTAQFPFPSSELPKNFTIKVEDISLD